MNATCRGRSRCDSHIYVLLLICAAACFDRYGGSASGYLSFIKDLFLLNLTLTIPGKCSCRAFPLPGQCAQSQLRAFCELYFSVVVALLLRCGVCFCVAAAFVGFFVAVKHLNPEYTDFAIFFLGAYPPSAKPAWLATAWSLMGVFLFGVYVLVK